VHSQKGRIAAKVLGKVLGGDQGEKAWMSSHDTKFQWNREVDRRIEKAWKKVQENIVDHGLKENQRRKTYKGRKLKEWKITEIS